MSESTTYKILLFLKRRADLSVAEFRDYYENHHVPLCLKYAGGVDHYVRRYLDPMPDAASGETGELPYDVITELWFSDEAVYRGIVQYLSTSIMPDEVVEDEKKLFDRSRTRFCTVEEVATR